MAVDALTIKVTKKQADYDRGMGASRCRNCTHYRPPHCEVVEGTVRPEMWCKYFKRRRP